MALVWNTATKRRLAIKDSSGKVVSVAIAVGPKSNPSKRILLLRPEEAKRRKV